MGSLEFILQLKGLLATKSLRTSVGAHLEESAIFRFLHELTDVSV